jgi:hypothetical protein
MSEPTLDPELSALEQALARLEPQAQLSRDAVFYQAGRAASRGRWLWPASTAASTLAAVVLGWLLWQRPQPETVVRVVYVRQVVPQPAELVDSQPAVEAEARSVADSGTADYLRRRTEVLRWGTEALHAPPPQPSKSEPLTPVAAPRLEPEPAGWKSLWKMSSALLGGDS